MKTMYTKQTLQPTTRRLLATAAVCGVLTLPLSVTAQDTSTKKGSSAAAQQNQTQWVETMEDVTIATSIQNEYIIEDKSWYNDVEVAVNDGKVTLTGDVKTLRDKRVAATLASTVRGVTSIDNKIKVTPRESAAASELAESVQRALLINTATESYEIDVKANDQGKVTLTGDVASYAERTLADQIAASTRGVRDVNNQIMVLYPEDRIDSEIRQDVVQKLKYDALIDASDIEVEVKNDRVTLSGQVGSLAEQRRAVMSAYVNGVKSVDDDKLTVDSNRRRISNSASMTDDEIEGAVENAMLLSPEVNSMNVTTFVYNDGRTQLTGDVTSLKAKQAAERLAKETSGVRRVDNFLRVAPDEQPDDNQIRRQIRQTLLDNSVTEYFEIDATVDDGSVTLSGNVDSYLEKWEAYDAVSSIHGVRSIDNEIDVQQTDTWFYYDPYVYPYVLPNADAQSPDRSTQTTDDEIAEDIESQFFWSPFVDGGDIDVTVDQGVAHLTGTVEDYTERGAATENAYEGGAVMVDNDLVVTGR